MPVFLERERARHEWTGEALPDDYVALDLAVDRLTGVLRQCRFRIERVHLAPAAAHEERNDGGRARFEVRRLRRVRIDPDWRGRARIARCRRGLGRQPLVAVQEVRERESADAAAGTEEKFTPVPEMLVTTSIAMVGHHFTSST